MVVFAGSSSTSSDLIKVVVVVEKQNHILSSRVEDPTDGA